MDKSQVQILDLQAEIISTLAERWTPHAGQIPIGRALFRDGFKNLFIQCGRNFGKTEFIHYCMARWAKQNPGSENYIFEPFANQAREISWVSNRLQNSVPEDWIDSINNVEMRIKLTNGSFIKLEGADNEEARRGIKPRGLVAYDEVKDMKESFFDSMEPNRAAFDVPALFTGTPPEAECFYTKTSDFAKTDADWFWYRASCWKNPHISHAFLERKKREMIAKGEYEKWQREYEAIFVRGGKNHLLPQFLELETDKQLILPKDINRWTLYTIFDPGSASVFGVLFVLFNHHTKKVKIMRNIYEDRTMHMTSRKIWDQVDVIIQEFKDLGVREFEYGYDEAATWFKNETAEIKPDVWLSPTQKSKHDKESGLGLLRDLIFSKNFEVDCRADKFIWEAENYIKDKHGKIPKVNDHLLDCARYMLDLAGFEFKDTTPVPIPIEDQKRGYTIEDDFAEQYTMAEVD